MTSPHEPDDEPEITIRDLYPHFTEDQLKAVEERLDRYLALMVRMTLRLEAEREVAEDNEH